MPALTGVPTTLPKTHNREGQTPPIINSWLRYCEKKILSIEVYFADTISLLYTLMYINITRFGYIQWHTHDRLQYTVYVNKTRGQNVLKILNGGRWVNSLNYPTPGSKFPISWVGWRCELGGSTPRNLPSNLTLRVPRKASVDFTWVPAWFPSKLISEWTWFIYPGPFLGAGE